MIRVVGANPAMDRISTWPPLRLDHVNRASTVSVVPGGKGFNVARAVVRLGESAAAHGFLGGHVGDALREMITADGVIDRHTVISDGTRVCFIVVEPDCGRSTVLNEPGPHVTAEEADRFLEDLRADVQPGDLVALSGSLPDSVDPRIAGEVMAIATEAGARPLVDIHGAALRAAAEQRPWVLKCNRRELLELTDAPDIDEPIEVAALAAEMIALRDGGIEHVVVTLGVDGAMVADADGVAQVVPPTIEVVNPIGSGDLVLAGLLAGVERGRSPREALPLGVAVGTAGATQLMPELPPGFDAAEWLSRIGTTILSTTA